MGKTEISKASFLFIRGLKSSWCRCWSVLSERSEALGEGECVTGLMLSSFNQLLVVLLHSAASTAYLNFLGTDKVQKRVKGIGAQHKLKLSK